ncbi:MAG: hypothetical protein QM278_06510 [Pseudomonadota bacterium]|nr:hypothetical protein [Pseudomonadota bacterium]
MLPDEIREHIKSLEQWLAQFKRLAERHEGLSAEEKKQLQIVNKAIVQFQRDRVSIPEDFQRLKLRLAARDAPKINDPETKARLKAVESLIQLLEQTIKMARSIRKNLEPATKIRTSKKDYGITLRDLLDARVLSTDDRLELQWHKSGPVLTGKVTSDGTVMVKTSNGWQHYNSLSTAASNLAGQSLNGWKLWRKINTDGTSISLEKIRAKYLAKEVDQ